MSQRRVEQIPWCRACYIMDVEDCAIAISRGLLDAHEVTAAVNATIIIERMIRSVHRKRRL